MKIIGGLLIYRLGKTRQVCLLKDGKTEHSCITADLDVTEKENVTRINLNINSSESIEIEECHIEAEVSVYGLERVFANGFQSWSESREFSPDEKQHGLSKVLFPLWRRYYLDNFGDSRFYKYSNQKGAIHSYGLTYLKYRDNTVSFYGSLCEASGYTVFETRVKEKKLYIKKECEGMVLKGSSRLFDVFFTEGGFYETIERYFDELDIASPKVLPDTGWTSWYNYYHKISEKKILKVLESFSSKHIPIDFFQIDDGYQTAVGDWLSVKDKFSSGMGFIASEVKRRGFKAGIWLAPFIAEENSLIRKNHPDWLVKNTKGKPFVVGNNPFNWSGRFYALNFYNEEVREYLRGVFRTVFDGWGFDLVKLDFLYAAAIAPLDGKTRGAIMCEAMEFLREVCGDKFILGCGVPLGAAFGKVDYCRIGSDVALSWEDARLKHINYRERVSTANSLESTVGRHFLNFRAFGNDPDVFILRTENCWLTEMQKKTLFLLNLVLGGLVFCSDNPSLYSKKQEMLYLAHFPHKKKTIENIRRDNDILRIEFYIDDLRYFLFSNLGDKYGAFSLEKGIYFESLKGFSGGGDFKLPPFASRCFLVSDMKEYSVAGSKGHIFPSSDIAKFNYNGDKSSLVFEDKAVLKDEVYIRISGDAEPFKINGKTCDISEAFGKRFIVYKEK